MIGNKILLIGNGINNIKSTLVWRDLINNLISYIGAASQINIHQKPFPLLYEEIFLEGVKNRGIREGELKLYIADKVAQIKHNEIHEEIMMLKFRDILTTNYDYSLEVSQGFKQEELKNAGIVNESTYSLFRNIQINNTKIWHIHGECNFPRTITLGYDHYSGYLQHMRNYVVMGTGRSYKIPFEALNKKIKNKNIKFNSWIDFFFTKDIYIIGFTLDFVEIHLWWLLTYRARRKYIKEIQPTNKIIYFYPENIAKKIRDKLELLRSNDVVPHSVKLRTYNKKDYYLEVLKKVKNI